MQLVNIYNSSGYIELHMGAPDNLSDADIQQIVANTIQQQKHTPNSDEYLTTNVVDSLVKQGFTDFLNYVNADTNLP